MLDILIIVSTWNRRDLTGICLDSIKRNKSPCSDVLILDDLSNDYTSEWLKQWGWSVEQHASKLNVGAVAKRRYTRFLESPVNYKYLCAVDNDLVFAKYFDCRLRNLWLLTYDENQLCAATGYRSVTQTVIEQHEGWVCVNTIGGAMNFTDRQTAQKIVDLMPEIWPHNWDHCISQIYNKIVCPCKSYAQHYGIYGSGVNGQSTDVAVDFIGEC